MPGNSYRPVSVIHSGRAMRMNNRSHRHIKTQTLSESLDGRIQGSALRCFEQDLAACQSCQEEMESLRSTIAMLRELP